MLGLMALCMFVGERLGGQQGMITAFVFAALMNFVSYWWSDKIVLAMHRAQPVNSQQMPELYRIVQELSMASGLPMPKLYVIPTSIPNAFATGRSPHHAAVAVTEGILNILDGRELKGVLGHELSHVKNRDVLISTIAATFAGVIMMLSRMAYWAGLFGGGHRNNERGGNPLALLVAMIVAPLAATLIQLAISRSREYAADYTGAKMTADPMALASALKKLHTQTSHMAQRGATMGTQATAHLYIVNPLRGDALMKLFSTHPPMEERVKRLEAMTI